MSEIYSVKVLSDLSVCGYFSAGDQWERIFLQQYASHPVHFEAKYGQIAKAAWQVQVCYSFIIIESELLILDWAPSNTSGLSLVNQQPQHVAVASNFVSLCTV